MNEYNHEKIEKKWQKKWEEDGIFKADDKSKKQKFYVLDMFPYPSGIGLHVGHPKGYIAGDIISRFKRMQGFNVLHPMGWDAFGLPAENYALENKIHPKKAMDHNIAYFKKQLQILGFDYDWSREINTTDPNYYKWTQWIFVQLFKKGLAYESNEPINWCPSCKTGLANEDLEGGVCERCGSTIEQKPMRQWVLNIRKYADRLLTDLNDLDWPESIKELQKNWIGRSEGAEVKFKVVNSDIEIPVYTTRIDTLFSGTYLILAPEHSLVQELKGKIENYEEVKKYIDVSSKKDHIERTNINSEKTGVELKGLKVINPATKEEMVVWIADFVLAQYGTGAVFADAHDQRDFDLAKKFNIPLKISVLPVDVGEAEKDEIVKLEKCFEGEGFLINSGKFDGMSSVEARPAIIKWLKKSKLADKAVNYKLRDWVFSRQRYWGEPIPIIHCEKCGVVPVPEKELPVLLPEVESYEPTGTGESPLANISEWVNTTCPKCGGVGKRETNTMPQWAGSSWYYLRYMDPNNDMSLVGKKKEKYWSPIDVYIGGAEHATRHLIYARFWHKFLKDIKVVKYDEPFKKLQHVGLIMGEDNRKMSKRWNNVVDPVDVVKDFGADSMRIYEMFMGPFDQVVSWSSDGIVGPKRFIEKIWRAVDRVSADVDVSPEIESLLHKTIKKVSEDIESMDYNTAISAMMILANKLDELKKIPISVYEKMLQLLAPFAPHITEELWHTLKHKESIHISAWPKFDLTKIKEEKIILAIQVNGKVRTELEISEDDSEQKIKDKAVGLPEIKKWVDGKEIKKIIYIEKKIVSIVVSN